MAALFGEEQSSESDESSDLEMQGSSEDSKTRITDREPVTIDEEERKRLEEKRQEELRAQQKRREYEEQEAREKEARRKNQKCVESLLRPILSLELLEKYDRPIDFPILPEKFEHPRDFISMWTELNLYETYNQLLN